MARLRRKPAVMHTKKNCKVCKAAVAEWVVLGQGHEGSYCSTCLDETTKRFHEENDQDRRYSLSEGEQHVLRRYRI